MQEGGDGLDRGAVGDQPQGREAVGADGQFDGAGGQQGRDISPGGAGQDLDIEAAPLIGPGGDGLIEAAVGGGDGAARCEAQTHPARFIDRRLGAAACSQTAQKAAKDACAGGALDQAAAGRSGGGGMGASHLVLV
ncbi:hypothetical protein D3C86_1208420 [compost metagenome]